MTNQSKIHRFIKWCSFFAFFLSPPLPFLPFFLSLFLLPVSNKFIFLTERVHISYSCFMDERFVRVTSCKLSIGDTNDARFLPGPRDAGAFSLARAARLGLCSRDLVSFHFPLLPGPHRPMTSLVRIRMETSALNEYTHLSDSLTKNRM